MANFLKDMPEATMMNIDIEAEQAEREFLCQMAENALDEVMTFLTQHFTPAQVAAVWTMAMACDPEIRALPLAQQEQILTERRQWATLAELTATIEAHHWALRQLTFLFPVSPATQGSEADHLS
jgi:hypothetical protein